MSKVYKVGEIVEIGGEDYVVVDQRTKDGCNSCDLYKLKIGGVCHCSHPDIGNIGCVQPNSILFKKVIEVDTPNIIQFIRPNKEGEYTLDTDTHIISYTRNGRDYTRTTSGEEIEFKFDIGKWVRVDECSSTDPEEATPVEDVEETMEVIPDITQAKHYSEYFTSYYGDINQVIFNRDVTIVSLNDGRKGVVHINGDDEFEYREGFYLAYIKALRQHKPISISNFYDATMIGGS